MKIQLILLICTLLFLSCRKTESNNADVSQKYSREYSPISFIKELKNKNSINVSTIENDFSKNWIKKQHLDSLISLIESKEKCNCYVNPLSSYIPNNSAEVGGFAIEFVKAYKENRNVDLGLYSCPKVNLKEVKELKSWWEKYNKTR